MDVCTFACKMHTDVFTFLHTQEHTPCLTSNKPEDFSDRFRLYLNYLEP